MDSNCGHRYSREHGYRYLLAALVAVALMDPLDSPGHPGNRAPAWFAGSHGSAASWDEFAIKTE